MRYEGSGDERLQRMEWRRGDQGSGGDLRNRRPRGCRHLKGVWFACGGRRSRRDRFRRGLSGVSMGGGGSGG